MTTQAQQVENAMAQLKANASPEPEQTAVAEVEIAPVEVEITPEAVEPEEIPPVDAPNSWSKAEKEHFNSLPLETQTSIATRERDRDLNIRKGHDETAAQRKELQAQTEAVTQQKADLLKRLQATGPQKPSENLRNPDHEDFDLDQFQIETSKFEAAQVERQKLETELTQADVQATNDWQKAEILVYQEVLPEYVDPVKGPAFRQGLAEYAVKNMGITMEEAARRFPLTPANEMSIMAKAMKYDAAVNKTRASKGKPAARTLNSGASNPSVPVKVDPKTAGKNWSMNRDRQSAAALFAEQRAKG